MQEWRKNARCLVEKVDTNFFFPSEKNLKDVRAAKAFCRGCPCRIECLFYAKDIHAEDGIYGGALYAERGLMTALIPRPSFEYDPQNTNSVEVQSPTRNHRTDIAKLPRSPFVSDLPFALILGEDQEHHNHSREENGVVPTESGFLILPFELGLRHS